MERTERPMTVQGMQEYVFSLDAKRRGNRFRSSVGLRTPRIVIELAVRRHGRTHTFLRGHKKDLPLSPWNSAIVHSQILAPPRAGLFFAPGAGPHFSLPNSTSALSTTGNCFPLCLTESEPSQRHMASGYRAPDQKRAIKEIGQRADTA